MSLFVLPIHLINRMNSLLRRFFWSGNMEKGRTHWVKGDTICSPKDCGGLGFREFHSFNMALVAKQAWCILENPSALWVRLLKSLYFPKSDFLAAPKHYKASWIWSGICEARSLIDLGAFKVVGNGGNISITRDPWVYTSISPYVNLDTGPFTMVADWILENPRRWDTHTISQYCNEEETEAIIKIPIGHNDLKDEWKWKFTRNGSFSVRSAYHAFRRATNQATLLNPTDAERKQWKWMWSLSLPPKILFFIWRCCNNALATNKNLARRKCATTPLCPICKNQEESITHCLFFCPHAVSVWRDSLPPNIPPDHNLNFRGWFAKFQETNFAPFLSHAVGICWNLWKARNNFTFRGSSPSTAHTIAMTIEDTTLWNTHRTTTTSTSPLIQATIPQQQFRPPPSTPGLVVHCD
ncbi:Putative ribonuclease H protein At1g65750 [Linum perenne]